MREFILENNAYISTVEFILEIESKLNIEFSDEEADSIETIKDLLSLATSKNNESKDITQLIIFNALQALGYDTLPDSGTKLKSLFLHDRKPGNWVRVD
ncbi:MAG: hypothetical protein OQK51_24705 [Kangiellaceae bacterium]|nr:hypothetical protein [Kangiellaceae bacterium]